ncbi:MAG: Asp-tRNA(Asn)/Glu-tRNA(Gln) amidotransferase subunit GatA [Patescibacteria group bacterium]|nr:Asp-tRNA(Asn)/Glu-tRNA(Gln) amidotransferase subunit GatA [Patescibacteria group bacterium]
MKLNELTIKQAIEKLDAGEITAVDLARACLDRIKEVDDKIKACLTVCEKEAIEEAKKADERRAKGEKGGLLGIPYIAKDIIMTKGVRTTAASKILENYIAPYDATIIKKLREAGAVLLGKANLDEFAHGGSTENSAFGPTHNPWDQELVPGGSSGGSGAAVAAEMCIFSLGTDTGGSVRCPASFCGVVGLKPTYGRSSRFGLISMTSSTDVPGAITKTAEDAALVLQAIAGHDKYDASTPEEAVPDYGEELKNSPLLRGVAEGRGVLAGLKIGLPIEYYGEGLSPAVRAALEEAKKKFIELGTELKDISLPHSKYAVPVYYIITPSEISSNLARFDGIKYGFSEPEAQNLLEVYSKSRGKGFGREAKRRIMLGTYALSAGYRDAYYLQAQKVRTKIKDEMDAALREVDVILTPTQPTVAYKIGSFTSDPLQMYLEDIFVIPASLAGLPAMSLPCGFDAGLPIGLQLIGARFDESKLFQVGCQYQKATDWHLKKPSL